MSAITSAARATNIRARMPADTNPSGDIFGGWIMSLMDVAGAITATRRAEGRVVTASVSNIEFLQPVKVGDCPLLGSADQAQRLMTANCQSRKSPLTPLRGTPGERWRSNVGLGPLSGFRERGALALILNRTSVCRFLSSPHRASDVVEAPLAKILETAMEPGLHLVVDYRRRGIPPWLRAAPRC